MNKKAKFILRNLKREVESLESDIKEKSYELSFIRLFNIRNQAKQLQNLIEDLGQIDDELKLEKW